MIRRFFFLAIIFVVYSDLYSQIATSSHYSRFGLGELYVQGNPIYSSLSNATTAINNPKTINSSNPASYASFSSKSFLLSTGGWHQTTRMENNTSEQIVNNNGFSHFIMGFPLSKKAGFSAGIIPFSSIGYNINTSLNEASNIQSANYSGDGGISKIYFGSAYRISDELSIGLNASYLFGSLNRRKELVYQDATFFNSRSNSKISLKGYIYELGAIFKKLLNDNEEYSIGLSAYNSTSISANKTELLESFRYVGVTELVKDTFVNMTQYGKIFLPRSINVGVSYMKDKKWLLLANYNIQNWSNYKIFDEEGGLENSQNFSSGIEYTPDYNSFTDYYKTISYRFGISYKVHPLKFNDYQLEEKSLSFGFGLPYKKSATKYDVYCVLGTRGSTNKNLIEENFFRIGLAISYYDTWFRKLKYD